MSASVYAVVMAGGSGTRFWPLSRKGMPKQFLRLLSKQTLLEETVRRVHPLIPIERVLVVTGRQHAEIVRSLLPDLPEENLLLEPMARNTAPCIGLAAIEVQRRDPKGVMAVLPADHFVSDEESFREVVATASRLAARDEIVTVGIRPMRPETGYGYIKLGDHVGEEQARYVSAFVEKPDFDKAVEYLASGRYLWNSGMFFFSAQRILAEFREHLPRHGAALGRIAAAFGLDDFEATLEREFGGMEGISIDYGIMEKASEIAVLVARFPWNDVGTWSALRDVLPPAENDSVSLGKVLELDGHSNVLVATSGLVAVLGMKDTVVVRSEEAVLVCPRSRTQDVRDIVAALSRGGSLKDYL